MYWFGRMYNPRAEVVRNPLVAQTDAEKRNLIQWRGGVHYRIYNIRGYAQIACVIRRSRAGRDYNMRWIQLDDFLERDGVVMVDYRVRSYRRGTVKEVIGERVVVVDDECFVWHYEVSAVYETHAG